MTTDKKLGVIGCGNMGSAIVKRLIAAKIFPASGIFVYDKNTVKCSALGKKYSVRVVNSNAMVMRNADIILLAVKPQQATEVLKDIKKTGGEGKLLISIMAGFPMEKIQKLSGVKNIVRCMPNTPAQIGYGTTVWLATSGVTIADKKLVADILGSFGIGFEVDDEDIIDMATAVSGSGPAYVFHFAQELTEAAVNLGLEPNLAENLVKNTLIGAVQLLDTSQQSATELKAAVTSKGGTTEAALTILRSKNTEKIWEEAIKTAYKRAKTLSKNIGQNNKN